MNHLSKLLHTLQTAASIITALAAISTLNAQDQNARVAMPLVPRRVDQNSRTANSIRVAVNLVLVPVLVTDMFDRPVSGLSKESFKLYEDGVEQSVSTFFSQERPVSVGILLDASSSMLRKMTESRQALSRLLNLSMPADEFSLIRFSDHPEKLLGFTRDAGQVETTVSTVQPQGATALFDAIFLGINEMKRAQYDRKALLIFSDGGDNNSRYTEHEIKRRVQESNVRVFAISIQDRSRVLEKLAEESGGRAFQVKSLSELEDVAVRMSAELHHEYILGYSPATQGPAAATRGRGQHMDGMYRKLKVQVIQASTEGPLRVSWRRGYYSPFD